MKLPVHKNELKNCKQLRLMFQEMWYFYESTPRNPVNYALANWRHEHELNTFLLGRTVEKARKTVREGDQFSDLH